MIRDPKPIVTMGSKTNAGIIYLFFFEWKEKKTKDYLSLLYKLIKP